MLKYMTIGSVSQVTGLSIEPGWKVFPITAGQKAPPLVKDWERAATNDPAQILAWSKQFPGCNWGLACGPSNIFVLDIDGPMGEQSLLALETKNGMLPPTREVRTPSGGRHLYFIGQGKTTAGKLGRKIDTRGDGGYVLLPGCVVGDKTYAVVSNA